MIRIVIEIDEPSVDEAKVFIERGGAVEELAVRAHLRAGGLEHRVSEIVKEASTAIWLGFDADLKRVHQRR